MYSTLFTVALVFVLITEFDIDYIPMGKHDRTYPCQTIFDKDVKYIRLLNTLGYQTNVHLKNLFP